MFLKKFDFEPAGGPPSPEVTTIEGYYFNQETIETIKNVFVGVTTGIIVVGASVLAFAVILGAIPVGVAATGAGAAAGVVIAIGLATKEIKEKLFNQ